MTGQKVTVRKDATGRTSYLLQPAGAQDDGVVSWQPGADADHYVVPVDALPYLGRGLDPSLFDVTALARTGPADEARIPVTLAFSAGTAPTAPPGVTLTSVAGTTAQGYLAPGAGRAFAARLHQRIAADVAAGRRPGSTPLTDGLADMTAGGTRAAVTDAAGPRVVTPHYPLHILQVTATDALGAPADTDAFVMNNDSLAREAADMPVAGGLGRIAVPAGNYTVATVFPTWNDDGDLTDLRQVTAPDVTVPDTGTGPTVALDARTATATVSLTTPRPSVREVTALDVERVDATGQAAASMGVSTWSGTAHIAVAPASAPSIGRLQYRTRFDTVATDPADAYRYDVAFSADHIDADQAYAVDPSRTATVHHSFSTDPAAADTTGSLLAGPYDSGYPSGTDEVSGYSFLTFPARLTEYVQTYPGSLWSETVSGPAAMMHGDARAFAAGRTYAVDWFHGPLAPTLGLHHTDDTNSWCLMCTAGPVASLNYQTAGDSDPDHSGFGFRNASLTAYVDGEPVASNPYAGAVLTGVPTGAATYRVVLTTDAGGDPSVSQSTHTVTDLTVKSPATPDPASALPASDSCDGASADTPCQILPALTMSCDLAADLTDTGSSAVQAMTVDVGHISYGGKGSTAPVTSLTVRVSFDGGTTWRTATAAGTQGHYVALWANPASAAAASPVLEVTAKDTLGGSLRQTITDAYTVAAAPASRY
ncbi:hypothetical protein [Actinacidiphila acidipaludis]|uniref:Uncharacterized protein n=1 Tax=Actinacidiphila acidipaludis TaxID=2873382 RepID=A0ABS7QE91_9ACTN|nr:hypothetical protein [Streptomyces acidipaludis]MBY8881480.1 hypothetical protein [Streptomyces acidipaludis]